MNSAGLTILFNTIGAALGPLLAGFVLLPQFGFQTSVTPFRSRLRRAGSVNQPQIKLVAGPRFRNRNVFA